MQLSSYSQLIISLFPKQNIKHRFLLSLKILDSSDLRSIFVLMQFYYVALLVLKYITTMHKKNK
jgi:hypothetical protein